MRIVFYVSGHGYGHAVRAGIVVRALARHGALVLVRTSAPAEAFGELPPGTKLEAVEVDPAPVHRTSLSIDHLATVAALERFWSAREQRIETEIRCLGGFGADLVVVDIAPLGVLAAAACDLDAIVIANFSWDFIYRKWSLAWPRMGKVAEVVAEAYSKTRLLLELPLSGGLDVFPERIAIPLIARISRRDRNEMRAELGVSAAETLVLLGFGGMGPPPFITSADRSCGVRFVVLGPSSWKPAGYLMADRSRFSHPDLVAACDLVLGKLGYGTVAECIVHQKPLLWLGRDDDFAEEPFLRTGLLEAVGGSELSRDELERGNVRQAIARALAAQRDVLPFRCDGAEVAARLIQRACAAVRNTASGTAWPA